MSSRPKSKKNLVPRSTKEMSKEMLEETLRKKKECNNKAMQIVEQMCEATVEETWFLNHLPFINQSHIDDIYIERAISKLCGYPLCQNELKDVPHKKYHISVKCNKVFDITERKNFCSNQCYQSGCFIRSQMLTSPLWFREHEVIPKFTLLKTCQTSGMGQEVAMSCVDLKAQKNNEVLKENVENVEFVQNEIEESENEFLSCEVDNHGFDCEPETDKLNNRPTITKSSVHKTEKVMEWKNLNTQSKPEKSKKDVKDVTSQYIAKVENSINEWFTIDTMLFLYGEEKVKEILSDRADEVKVILTKRTLRPGFDERIDRLMKHFSLLDSNLESVSESRRELQPLPDYRVLKADASALDVKVKAFYSGQLEVQCGDVLERQTEVAMDDDDILMPTVDSNAQHVLRRRIVMDKLNKIIPDVLKSLCVASVVEMSEVRSFISHCTLEAHNISFKQGEWFLLALILIKLLSIRNHVLRKELATQSRQHNLTLFLLSYQLPQDYLDNIVEWLGSCELLVNKSFPHGNQLKT